MKPHPAIAAEESESASVSGCLISRTKTREYLLQEMIPVDKD
jgi:hypothetical protein